MKCLQMPDDPLPCFLEKIGQGGWSSGINTLVYVFRHFWLDFMLFLTSKLLKTVNFGALGHFGQHALAICV